MKKIAALLVAFPLVATAQQRYPPQYAPPPQQPRPQQQQQLAQYQQPGVPPQQAFSDAHRHRGLFIRPELGSGYQSGSASNSVASLDVSGGEVTLGLAIGGAMTENFILAGHVWDVVENSPSVKIVRGGISTTITTDSNTDASLVGYGVLLNWYLTVSFSATYN